MFRSSEKNIEDLKKKIREAYLSDKSTTDLQIELANEENN
jgi:hypothetical protein